jgi:hypothetical protein
MKLEFPMDNMATGIIHFINTLFVKIKALLIYSLFHKYQTRVD